MPNVSPERIGGRQHHQLELEIVNTMEKWKQDLLDEIKLLYPDKIEEHDHPFSSIQFQRRKELCSTAMADSVLRNRWNYLKQIFAQKFDRFRVASFDSELLAATPVLRYGIEIEDNSERKMIFYFCISLIKPYCSWYFIDYERFPKNKSRSRTTLGPPLPRFESFGLMNEYEPLCSGELSSVLEIKLNSVQLLTFCEPQPRFE